MNITFLHFNIEYESTCDFDWIEIEGEKYCGEIGTSTEISTPFTIITDSYSVDITFSSDGRGTHTGFLAIWSQYNIPIGCNNCDFPFTFGDTVFETCISVQDVDTQPWCSYNITTPIITDYPYPKITCTESDSSCPSSPSQTVITSPDYPALYPNNADEVT